MLPAAPFFPVFTAPEGWKTEPSGPKLWVTPPEPGARIVIPPVLAKKNWLDAKELLERTLLEELRSFPKVKRTDTRPIQSASGIKGFFAEIAGLEAGGAVNEWRSYVAYDDDPRLYLMFLQAKPARFVAVRPAFLAVASSVISGAVSWSEKKS